jgi:hypothetical protein
MQAVKRLGIWMDHSSAHLIEYSNAPMKTKVIESTFTHQERESSLKKGESLMHNKEQQRQGAYYEEIGEVIKQYEEVLLFGPTDAKTELFNLLAEDQHFAKIKMEVKSADKMTKHEEQAFVRSHYSAHPVQHGFNL